LPFTDWIGRLLAHRRQRTGSPNQHIAAGIHEAVQFGTSLVGDIVTGDWLPGCVPEDGPSVVAFRELIGLLPDQIAPQLELAKQHIADCRTAQTAEQRVLLPAISPHAPYSVSPDLFHGLVDLARTEEVPLCIHLAETLAELELLNSGTGEFFEMLTRFDLWREGTIPVRSRPMDYLKPLSNLPHALIAHGNYLADDEINFLASHPNIATVFCPRTHAFFGHSNHPWERLIDAGATVCIGTDGRSSNPDYSLWAELQFLARSSVAARAPQILDAGTRQGASALGQENQTGTITAGKRADLTVISLNESTANDPWRALFAADSKPATTIIMGSEIGTLRS
jgi:aminodeoxyfutalosine deaminase